MDDFFSPYICPVCNKTFRAAGNFKRHKTMTGHSAQVALDEEARRRELTALEGLDKAEKPE